MGVIFTLAIATSVKMVKRQVSTIHLRLIRTLRYSPRADSCVGRSGYRRTVGRARSEPIGGWHSRIIAVLACGLLTCTSGPESMHAPQRICKAHQAIWRALAHISQSRFEEAGSSRRRFTCVAGSSGLILALDGKNLPEISVGILPYNRHAL